MTERRWWVQQPPNIRMTDARARQLLSGASTLNNNEWVFVQANASTIVPKVVPNVPAQSQIGGASFRSDIKMPVPYKDD